MWMTVLAALAVSPMATQVAAPMATLAADGPVRFGAVTIEGNLVCLRAEPAPTVGTRILLVEPEAPQKTYSAVVAPAQCPASAGQGGPAPQGVQLTWTANGHVAPLIGVIGPVGRVTTRSGQVAVSTQGAAQALRFRSCASSDGLHLTAWRGVPLRSPRAWHGYVYLNQDLDADCTASETR